MVKQMSRKRMAASQQDGLVKNYNSYHTNEDSHGFESPFRKPFEEKYPTNPSRYEVYVPKEYLLLNQALA
ncbi:MAG: hypothetical protein AAF368_00370, partial [Planctomycetota bacterium]